MRTGSANPAREHHHDDGSSVFVHEGPNGRTSVRIAGDLPVGWMGSLSRGMSEAGLSIERGSARRTDRRFWKIELEIDARAAGRSLAAGDYLSLASRRLRHELRPIVVSSYTLQRPSEPGPLVLDLTGVDCVGFLGSLLERLAGLLLFPVEMQIETIGARAVDRLCLRSLGGRSPSPEAAEMLGALLDRLKPEALTRAPCA